MNTPVNGILDPVVGAHTVRWLDGLNVTRVYVTGKQIILAVTWKGEKNWIRLGKRTAKIARKYIP